MSLFEFQKSLVETMWRSLWLCGSSKASSTTSSAPQWLVEWWLHVQQQQQQQQQHRSLQGGGGAGGHGTLAILIIVSILFCLVWTPTLFRRCGFSSYRDRLEAEQAEAEAIRAVLQAGEHDVFSAAAAAAAASASSPFGASYYRHHHPGMATASLEDRRNYVGNILITKRVLKCDPSNTKDDDEGQQPKSRNERRKSDLYITVAPPTTTLTTTTQDGTGDDANTGRKNEQAIQHDELPKDDDDDDVVADVEKAIPTTTTIPNSSSHTTTTTTNHGDNNNNDDDDDSGEACPICLNDYAEGDEICWSHNHSCNHVFHRECILEWLLRHEDCPCCRHNFLSVDDNSYPPLAYTTSMHNPIDEQSWGNTNLFWSPLRIPPLPRIDADEEEFWNRIHEFRHFARRYLNGPYPSNGYGASSPTLPTTTSTTNMNPSLNSLSGVTTNNNNHTLQSEYPPPYLSRSTRAYPSTGLSIFQLEDPSPAYSLAIGRSTNRFSASFGPPAAATTTTTTTNVNNNTDSELPSSASGTTTAGGSSSQRLGASAIGANRIGLDEGDDESSSDSSSQSDSSSDRNDRQRGRLPSNHSLQPTANHVPAAAEGGRVENTDRDMEAIEQNSTFAEAVPDPQLLVVVARSSNESSSEEVVPSHVVVTIDTRGEADQPETADDDHLEVTDPPAQESDTTHHTSSLNGSSEV